MPVLYRVVFGSGRKGGVKPSKQLFPSGQFIQFEVPVVTISVDIYLAVKNP